jgi:hypothetical protein
MTEGTGSAISKVEAARRQLDTAIDLWFEDRDALSVFTLAFASLKVLFGTYAHQGEDGFNEALDQLIGESGWRSMSRNANFLKHADRDPDAVLSQFHPDMGMPLIGLATLLYRRLTGGLSLKMQAFDSWTEMIAAEELGIPEIDQNADRAQANRRIRDALKVAPREAYMRYAHRYYEFFLDNRERLEQEVDQALATGATLQDVFDQKFSSTRLQAPPDTHTPRKK